MCDIRVMSRNFLAEFIQIYKEEECLWKLSSPDYLNKFLKKQAYKRLVSKLQEVEQHADDQMVKRKIYSMRNNYRSEMKKVKRSMSTATSEGGIYRPTLWYFDLLDFLRDQEVPQRSKSMTRVIEMDNDHSQLGSEYSINSEEDVSILEPETAIVTCDSPPPRRTISVSNSEPRKKRKIIMDSLPVEEILNKVSCSPNSRKDDDEDIFGKHIAAKLRKVTPRMQIIAEKLISDVIFYAQTETLDMESRVVTGVSNHKLEY